MRLSASASSGWKHKRPREGEEPARVGWRTPTRAWSRSWALALGACSPIPGQERAEECGVGSPLTRAYRTPLLLTRDSVGTLHPASPLVSQTAHPFIHSFSKYSSASCMPGYMLSNGDVLLCNRRGPWPRGACNLAEVELNW